MKVLNRKVRLHDANTLEFMGEYEKDRVGIIGEMELVPDFRRHWPIWVIIILLMLGVFVVGWMATDKAQELQKENYELEKLIQVAEEDINVELLAGIYATSRTKIPKDKDEVYKMCVQSGAWYPEIIMAQLILESSVGTSDVGKNARNLYGMKKVGPGGRPTLQIPDVNYHGYGMYLNWQHSVLDRVLWDDWVFKKKKPATREQYLAKLDGVYAEDPNYIAKITCIASEWEGKTDSIRTLLEQDSVRLIQ